MSSVYFAPIVEGHGEQEALPILLRRLCGEIRPDLWADINPPIRVKSANFINDPDYFYKYLSMAANKARQAGNGAVLILLDCEDDCPKELGLRLLSQARKLRPDVRIIVVLAYREFETWFLASVHSLVQCGLLPNGTKVPNNPEGIRDAKGWLKERRSYKETDDQPTFTARFSFDEASSISSFRYLRRKIEEILLADIA